MLTTPRSLTAKCVFLLFASIVVPAQSSAQTGLVASYSFSEGSGATVTDSSGNGNHGVIAGASWTQAGRFGSALQFDGIDDLVTIADSASLDLTGPITMEAWVYPTDRSRSPIFLKELAGGLSYALYAYDNGMRPSVRIGTIDGDRNIIAGAALPLAAWTHVAATYDGATLRLYIDGVEVGAKLVERQIRTSVDPLRVGGRFDRGEFFQGRIDEIRIYNRTLSATEIVADMNAPPMDLVAPTVSIASPLNGSTVSVTVTISATATDNVGVAGVRFLVDGAALGAEDLTAPYQIEWNTTLASSGSHTLTAIARDAAGNETTSAPVTVNVDNTPPADTAAPTVAIASPAAGSTVSGAVTVSASASDDLGVVGVQFMLDGAQLGPEDIVAPYSVSWDTTLSAPGGHTLTAIARDAAGNSAGSPPVTVTVDNAPSDTTAPTIAIASPTAGSTVSGVITISASASDDVGVAGVQFLLDGVAFGAEDTSAPYSVSWDTSLSSAGGHALAARARDAAGNLATSGSVSVTVSNTTIESQIGSWSAPVDLGLVMVHASLLHTGKVLMWRGENSGGSSATLWDPNTGALRPVPNSFSNLFCSGHTALADGTILVAGGHDNVNGILGAADVNLFDPVSESWRGAAPMAHRRWYPTATTLADGRVLVTSGADSCLDCLVDVPELYDPATNVWTQLTSASLGIPLYPFVFVLPDGRLLLAGTAEDATATRTLDLVTQTWTMVDPNVVDGGSAVMYAPGKILKSGSAATSGDLGLATNTAFTLDMTAAVPVWQQTQSMAFPRAYHNLVMLPDGNVLAVGGDRTLDGRNPQQAVFEAELWSPSTGTWRTMAPMAVPRMYHETALLLPDARVLVGGSGDDFSGAPEQTTIEIYSPPYLFRGARPAITSAPSLIPYGSQFTVHYSSASVISSVVLIRPASVTHQFDENQRFISLPFSVGEGGLSVTAPTNANAAPPGYYMLFLVNGSGVPSVAAFVRLPGPADDSLPPTSPVLTASGGQGSVSLSWSASTDDTGVAAYNVHRSTVSGFTPSTVNRLARTTATSFLDSGLLAGTYFYVVVAEDIGGNLSAPSNQAAATATADAVPPTVSITQPADGASVSGFVGIFATASDNVRVLGVQFLVDGAPVGSESTSDPYNIFWPTTTVANGVHMLTAVARDAAGNRTTSAPVTVTVSNVAPVPAGLVAAYAFDEGIGTTVGDASGSGNTGTISGATWTTLGHSGGALSFDGVNDWVTIVDAATLDLTTGMTLEAWVNPANINSWRTVVLKETIGGLAYALYASNAFGLPAGFVRTGQDVGATSLTSIPLNTWTHLAVTYDGTTVRLFVNGVQAAAASAGGSIAQSAEVLRIGGNAVWNEFFNGRIDDVRIYRRALTAAEIQQDMTTPVR